MVVERGIDTPGREHETPRSINRREEYEEERERGQSLPRGGNMRVQEEETHILPCYRVVGAGLGTPPEENPKPLENMEEGRSMKGREARGEERQFADVPFRKETRKSEFMEGERGVVVEKGRQCVKRGFLRGKEIDRG